MIVGYQDASYKLSNQWKGMVWCFSQRREISSGVLIWLKYLFTYLWEQMEHLGILENTTSFTFNLIPALPEFRDWRLGNCSLSQFKDVNSKFLAQKIRQWISNHLHCNIFMSQILSNTSVTRNADTWYVGETSISTSSLFLRQIGKTFTRELIFGMSRPPSWLEVNYLSLGQGGEGIRKLGVQKCWCLLTGLSPKGEKAPPQAYSFSRSHFLPLGVCCCRRARATHLSLSM